MIHTVSSDHPSFHTVNLTPGFNLIVADRTQESTRRDSRNGLGKSTLIEIIHFCLGSSARKNKGLMVEQLNGWEFSLEMTLGDSAIKVSRNTTDPASVRIEGPTVGWPIRPREFQEGAYLKLADWNLVLGHFMFGLPIVQGDRGYTPSFRSLISYFIRRGLDAFSSPFEHFRKQREWDKQVNNAFLLGLAWEEASDWQTIKDKEQVLFTLRKAGELGAVQGYLGSVGELEAEIILLEEQVSRDREQLRTFRVHPQYREIETLSNQMTAEIHNLSNENITDRRLLEFYRNSMMSEQQDNAQDIIRLYEQVGVELPSFTRRRLQDVQEFHARVIQNREQFLSAEVSRLERAVETREQAIRARSDERASHLEVLRSHGALEEFSLLQQHNTEHVSKMEDLRTRLRNLRNIEEGRSSLRIERESLQQRARIGFDQSYEMRRKAISLFNDNSQSLYQVPGNLIVDLTPKGFAFDVDIPRAESQGVSHMKVFCYDLMLAQLWAERRVTPGVLVHDSTIFDGVDGRQVALALERASTESQRLRFQYICTLNSDAVPVSDFSRGFNINQFIRLQLTDTEPSQSLLGIRY